MTVSLGSVGVNPYRDIGAEFEKLKSISDEILTNVYWRKLVPNGIYNPKHVSDGEEFVTVLPTEGNELALYNSKVSEIVMAIKQIAEKKLGRSIAVENLTKELDENHSEFFNYIM